MACSVSECKVKTYPVGPSKSGPHSIFCGQFWASSEPAESNKGIIKTDCKWTISELTPNQITIPFTTKMGNKTYQGERKFLDDSMIETSYISAKPTVVTFKRVE